MLKAVCNGAGVSRCTGHGGAVPGDVRRMPGAAAAVWHTLHRGACGGGSEGVGHKLQ